MYASIKPAAALLPLLLPMASLAQELLDPVVVTATRQESRVSQVLADVTVIDRATLERNAGSTIMDLLAQQPGVQISTTGNPVAAASLYLRGTRSDQTKILIDGLPINSTDLAGSPLRYIPLATIDRVEILRGPASTLYGPDAIGGVIQIFTRKGTPGFKADAFIGYGTQNTAQTNASVSGGNSQWRFQVTGSYDSSDAYSAQTQASRQDADKDGYRNRGATWALALLPAQGHEIGLLYRHNEGRAHYDSGNAPANGTFDARVDFRTEQWQLYTRNRLNENWASTLQYGQTTDWQHNYYNAEGNRATNENHLLDWQNDIALPLGRGLLGLTQQEQKAGPQINYVGSRTLRNTAVFASWHADLAAHRWQISTRNDDHNQFGNKTTYAFAYGYQITPAWRVHASYGNSFKAPSLYQLYDQYSGNAKLNPEEGVNREAALTWEQGQQSVSLTYYLNRIRNMIDWSNDTYTYQNVGKARLNGATLTYNGHWLDWTLYASYDGLSATDADSGKRLGRRARNKLSGGARTNFGALEAGVEAETSSSRYNDNKENNRMGGYGLINLTARYALRKNIVLEGRINNLFDRNYALALATSGNTAVPYATPGINAFMGIRYTAQ